MASAPPQQPQTLAETPVLSPPKGVVPNFQNPHGTAVPVEVVDSILLAMTILFITNRICSKIWIVRKYSWDDGMLHAGDLSERFRTNIRLTTFRLSDLNIGFCESRLPP